MRQLGQPASSMQRGPLGRRALSSPTPTRPISPARARQKHLPPLVTSNEALSGILPIWAGVGEATRGQAGAQPSDLTPVEVKPLHEQASPSACHPNLLRRPGALARSALAIVPDHLD